MHELVELKEKLMKELAEYSENGKYSKEDVETIKYIASAIDHLCNIIYDKEDEEYSQRNYAYENGGMGGGGSYRNGGRYPRTDGGSYMGSGRNSYARGRGTNARRDSMGRYSRNNNQEMIGQLEDLMQDAPNDQIRQQIQQLITQVEQMQ